MPEPFPWEALATACTGLAAVVGAVIVGLRQNKISDRQNKILSRQVHLDELALRSELYDRRFKVYDETRKFIARAFTGGELPPPVEMNDYLKAMTESRFLFSTQIHETLKTIWREVSDLHICVAHIRDARASGEQVSDEDIAKEAMIRDGLNRRLENISDIFADELNLAVLSDSDLTSNDK